MVAIWPFLNGLPERKLFGHLAIFWILKKIVYFKACFWEIWAKLAIFYEIIPLNLVILTNLWRKFDLYLAFLSSLRIWPFWNCLWPNLAFLIFLDLATLGYLLVGGKFMSVGYQFCYTECVTKRDEFFSVNFDFAFV